MDTSAAPPTRAHIGTLDRLADHEAARDGARRFMALAEFCPTGPLAIALGGLEADWLTTPRHQPALAAYMTAFGEAVFALGGKPALERLDEPSTVFMALAMDALVPIRMADGTVKVTDPA